MRKFIIFSFLIFISFIQANIADPYPYWIENDGGTYNIWTRVNVSANSNKVIYIKKVDGFNPNGDAVFEFFDDFGDGTLSWTTNGWSVTTSEGNPAPCATASDTWVYMYANTQPLQKYIISCDFKTPHLFNILFACDASGYGYMFRVESRSGYSPGFGDSSAWGGRILSPTWVPPRVTGNTWGHCEIVVDGTSAKADVGNGVNYSKTISPQGNYFGVEIDGLTGAQYIDNFIIRKYADQDPSITIEQRLTNTWKVTIYNPNAYDLSDFQVRINGTGIISSKTDSLLLTDASDFCITTDKTIYALSQTVNLTLYSAESIINKTAYIDWGDATTDAVVIESTRQSITHTYNVEGTYTINAVVENSTDYKTIIVSTEVVETTLNFKPLYSNLNISDVKLFISSTVDAVYLNTTNNSVQINAMLNKPITIQSDSRYITTISAINGTKTVLIGTPDIQYVKLQYSTTDGHNIGIYYDGTEVGYGNPVLCTLPANSYAKIYIDGIYYKEEQFTVSKTRYIPFKDITPEVIFTNGESNTLKIIIKPNVGGFYKFEIESENQVIYSELQYLKDNWNTISTNIPTGNATYTLKVYGDGTLIASKELSPNYPIQTNFGELNSFYKVIALLFLLGVILLLVMIGRQHAWIGFLSVALLLMIFPIDFPVAGKYLPYMVIGLALVTFIIMKYKGEE